MAHSRRSRFHSTSARRSTSWSGSVEEVDGSLSSSATSLWSLAGIPSVEGLTIIRTRGVCGLTLLSATAAGDGFFGAIGIGITTDEAIAVGVTAVPGPITDDSWDGWLYHQYFDLRSTTATIADGTNISRVVIEIDSKAMRKFPVGMTVFGSTEVVESGTATLEIQAATRMLFKNP